MKQCQDARGRAHLERTKSNDALSLLLTNQYPGKDQSPKEILPSPKHTVKTSGLYQLFCSAEPLPFASHYLLSYIQTGQGQLGQITPSNCLKQN